MDYRSPLQHLLHSLLPTKAAADPTAGAADFVDTQPVDERAAAAQAARRTIVLRPTWAESALDLAAGSDVTELPEDAAADLMDQFFAKSKKKAA